MEKLLTDPGIKPSLAVLEKELGKKLFGVYRDLSDIAGESGISHEWRFYKDGKAWLCKFTCGKETVFWLSLWKGYIKTSFYFNGKSFSGVFDQEIDDKIKKDFSRADRSGKLIALILDINTKKQLADFKKIMLYKRDLKGPRRKK